MQVRPGVVLAALVLGAGCGGGGRQPPPAPAPPPSPATTVAPTTTVAPVPTLTAEPIAGADAAAIHRELQDLGFTTGAPKTEPGFVTTTSTRPDATVSTYGKGPGDVVKIIAQADTAAAATVLPAVAASLLEGSTARRADAWVKAELKKGARSPAQPRTSRATYGAQPYEMVITTTAATLSIGRLSD